MEIEDAFSGNNSFSVLTDTRSNRNASNGSQRSVLDFDDILYELSYQAIIVVGVCGNILGITFLWYTNVRTSFHIFLISLMINDVVYLLIVLTRSIFLLLLSFEKQLLQYNLRVALIYLKVIHILLFNTSAFIITSMSLERFVRVYFPFRRTCIGTRRFAIAAICVGFVLNIAVFIPQFILQDVPKSGASHINFSPFKLKNVNGSLAKVYPVVGITISRYIPATVAFLVNVFLLTKLLQRYRRRAFIFANRESRKDRIRFDDLGTTITLILITTFLLLSLVPAATAQILAQNYPELYLNVNRKENAHYKFLMAFGKFVSALSAANDFVLYILLSRRSRVTLKHIITKRWCNCDRRHSQISYRSRAIFSRRSADSNRFIEQTIHHVDTPV